MKFHNPLHVTDDCVYPASTSDQQQPTSEPLIGPDGKNIKSVGKRTLRLNFGGGKHYVQEFWIANINKLILGVNFFIANDLFIDLKRRQLHTDAFLGNLVWTSMDKQNIAIFINFNLIYLVKT